MEKNENIYKNITCFRLDLYNNIFLFPNFELFKFFHHIFS